MRIIGEVSIGGKSIRLVELAYPPWVRMEIYNSEEWYVVDLNTEMMTQLRHILRMACRITRVRDERERKT